MASFSDLIVDSLTIRGASAGDDVVLNGASDLVLSKTQPWADPMHPEYGAIGDGGQHPLSERYATLAEAQEFYPLATSLDQTIDTCALEKAARASSTVRLPPDHTFVVQNVTYGEGQVIEGHPSTVVQLAEGLSSERYVLSPREAGVKNARLMGFVVDQRSDHYGDLADSYAVSVEQTDGLLLDLIFRRVITMAVWCDTPSTATTKNLRIRGNIEDSQGGGYSLFGSIDTVDIDAVAENCQDDAFAVQENATAYPKNVKVRVIAKNCNLRNSFDSTPHGVLLLGVENAEIHAIVDGTVASGVYVTGGVTNPVSENILLDVVVDNAGSTVDDTTGVPGNGVYCRNVTGLTGKATVRGSREAGISLRTVDSVCLEGSSRLNGAAGVRIDGCTDVDAGRLVSLDNGIIDGEPYGFLVVSTDSSDKCSDINLRGARAGDTRTGESKTQTHGLFISGSDTTKLDFSGANFTGNATAGLGGVGGTDTIRGKYQGGGSPTVEVGAQAGTGATVSISGDDTSGVVTINTGTGAVAGQLAVITFAAPYGAAQPVRISPMSIQAVEALSFAYASSAAHLFEIDAAGNPPSSQTLKFAYSVG